MSKINHICPRERSSVGRDKCIYVGAGVRTPDTHFFILNKMCELQPLDYQTTRLQKKTYLFFTKRQKIKMFDDGSGRGVILGKSEVEVVGK